VTMEKCGQRGVATSSIAKKVLKLGFVAAGDDGEKREGRTCKK